MFTGASDQAVESVVQQWEDDSWKPIGFFAKKLNTAEKNHSTYVKELLSIFLSIKYFKHLLEDREFKNYTDHKPLTFAFSQKQEKCSPRQVRQLQFILQFTTEIEHIPSTENIIEIDSIKKKIDFDNVATMQQNDQECQNFSKKLKRIQTQAGNFILCDCATETIRPFIPAESRFDVFQQLHNLSHPGIKATIKMIKKKFVWPHMDKQIKEWTRSCLPSQKNYLIQHTKSGSSSYQQVALPKHIHKLYLTQTKTIG